MFKQLATIDSSIPADKVVKLHPSDLISLLEFVWDNMIKATSPLPTPPSPGDPDKRSAVAGLPPTTTPPFLSGAGIKLANEIIALTTNLELIRWHHLIYAYMIENTRIYEIFRRVVHEMLHGEKLGSPNVDTQQWLRNTEELFYRDQPPFSITTVSSHIRSDLRASRRNAYQRMFGMDLNHGTDEGQPYPFVKADAANSEFVTTFEELLREVWVGMIHVSAISAPNPTDDAKIAALATRLENMLMSRRQHGNLSREEFVFVSMMSWFHLTVESDLPLPIIEHLKAGVRGAEQRLFKIAQSVGLPAHGLSKSYFDIAEPISRILIAIEMETYNNVAAVPALYTPASSYPPGLLGPGPASDMSTIITHWSLITGKDIKAGKVAAT